MTNIYLLGAGCVGTLLLFLARQVALSEDFVAGYERLTIFPAGQAPAGGPGGDFSVVVPALRVAPDVRAIALKLLPSVVLYNGYCERLGEEEVMASGTLYDRYDVLRRAMSVRIEGVLNSHGLGLAERRAVWREVWRMTASNLLDEVAAAA